MRLLLCTQLIGWRMMLALLAGSYSRQLGVGCWLFLLLHLTITASLLNYSGTESFTYNIQLSSSHSNSILILHWPLFNLWLDYCYCGLIKIMMTNPRRNPRHLCPVINAYTRLGTYFTSTKKTEGRHRTGLGEGINMLVVS
jgi:hypothetical protein